MRLSFLYCYVKIFSLSLVFRNLIMCLGMDFFGLAYLGFAQPFNLQVSDLWQIWKTFSHYFFEYFLAPSDSFFFPSGTLMAETLVLLLQYQRSWASVVHFFFSLSLLSRLGNFYHSIFKFTDFLFCHLYWVFKFFILIIVFFNSKISIWLFFISFSLQKKIFLFVSSMVIISHEDIFAMSALKSLSDNSKSLSSQCQYLLVAFSHSKFFWFLVW